MIIENNNQYAVECQTKISKDCLQNGAFCDSEDDAHEWVESDCWIDSGEGWICTKCNEQILQNLKNIRPKFGR